MLLLVDCLNVLRNLIPHLFMISLALAFSILLIKVFVDIQRTQGHVIPELWILRKDADADLLEAFESLVVFARSIES